MSTTKFPFHLGDISGNGVVWKTASVVDNRLLAVTVLTHSAVTEFYDNSSVTDTVLSQMEQIAADQWSTEFIVSF